MANKNPSKPRHCEKCGNIIIARSMKYSMCLDCKPNPNTVKRRRERRKQVQPHSVLSRPTALNERTKIRLCLEWLHWCVDHGWPKSSADALERIFWKFDGWKTFKGYTPFRFSR
jgi:hypothetical protein